MHRFGVAGSAARLYGSLVSGIIPTPRCDGDCNASVAAEGDRTAVQRGGAFCRAGRRARLPGPPAPPQGARCGAIRPYPSG